jgi:hypothetical protein
MTPDPPDHDADLVSQFGDPQLIHQYSEGPPGYGAYGAGSNQEPGRYQPRRATRSPVSWLLMALAIVALAVLVAVLVH